MFFDLFIVVYDFPEFREQLDGYHKVLYCDPRSIERTLDKAISIVGENSSREFQIDSKIAESISNIRSLLNP